MAKVRSARGWWVILALLAGVVLLWDRYRTWRESSQDGVILAASSYYGVSPALVKAVVWKESGFDPKARGSKGEIGLMQLMERTAGEWASAEKVSLHRFEDLYDPALNTRAGTWYLRKAYKRYLQTDNPIPYALADYNAGRNNVLRWAKGAAATNSQAFVQEIGFRSTKDYVIAITQRYQRYARTFPASPSANQASR